jgi:hypothetical protein
VCRPGVGAVLAALRLRPGLWGQGALWLRATIHRVDGVVEESLPFRWDLVTPDQLGSLLVGTATPDLWFLDELVACAGKVLARSGNGDLVFVGRSLDSMFDLLSGALADLAGQRLLRRLPLSFQRPSVRSGRR